MAHGAPDWTRQVQIVLVAAQPLDEVVAGHIGDYTGTDTEYQPLVSWTVATGKIGELKEITIVSSLYSKTEVEITIFNTVWKDVWSPQSVIPLIFEDLRGAALSVCKVRVRSTDGSSINVDAVIVGKEVG